MKYCLCEKERSNETVSGIALLIAQHAFCALIIAYGVYRLWVDVGRALEKNDDLVGLPTPHTFSSILLSLFPLRRRRHRYYNESPHLPSTHLW